MIRARTVLFALAALVAAVPIGQRVIQDTTVFGGEEVQAGTPKYKYVVKLKDGSDTICGGIAVGELWVLTAAHCAPDVQGAVPFDEEDGILIDDRFCHHKYVKSELPHLDAQNDLALLKTKKKLKVTPWNLKQVANPSSDGLLVFGWGRTDWLELVFNTELRKSKPMKLQGELSCNEHWKKEKQVVDASELCAGHKTSSACKGDSGGPLFNTTFINSKPEPENLVGILSKADDACNEDGEFDIYTRIDSTWINQIIDDKDDMRSKSRVKC
jgi:secreted trypsin-like serine protease